MISDLPTWKKGLRVSASFRAAAALLIALALPSLACAQHYTQTNLVSNTGSAPVNDGNLQNAWGLVSGPLPAGTPWWVSNNAGGTATLYSVDPTGTTASIVPLVVTIPNAPDQPAPGSPTGVMFNGNPNDFLLAPGKPAFFIFVTEDGTVQGWNPGVALNNSVIKVDNSKKPDAQNGAVYKGATIAEIDGKEFILAANFRSGRVDTFDSNFHQVHVSEEAFEDDRLPEGFAPFNIQGVGPNIYVTYAKQDAARHDPVGGEGLGFVDVFNSHGRLVQRLEHGPWMNAPWGTVWAAPGFGEFSNTILIGQFRGGNIAAFNPITGKFLGNALKADGSELKIDGLWALGFALRQ